jgi:predicted 3-demethylubiquinone-9 3-methyltransferase (glyoxalase superfamily)
MLISTYCVKRIAGGGASGNPEREAADCVCRASGGQEGPCGWLKDKFGLSWQVIPKALPQMLTDENSEKAQRVMRSMLQMHKIDLAALERAQAA